MIQSERLHVTEEGKDAILALANGDLRRVLNLLQATSMAYPSVNEDAVYLTAGAAVPKVIENMLTSLMNDTFADCYSKILQVGFHSNRLTDDDESIIYTRLLLTLAMPWVTW